MSHGVWNVRARVLGAVLILLLPGVARAQTPHTLVPILTNQESHQLPNRFGIPQAVIANDDGDFAFIGLRATALFYRQSGAQIVTRVIQNGDEIPGLAGSRLSQLFTPLLMNGNGVIAVRADVYTTNRLTHAILTFDGTTLRTLATGFDAAPGTGAKFERTMTLIDLNDAGDVVVGATLLPTGSLNAPLPTVFLMTAAGPIVRVAGPGDASPGTGGTFTAAVATGLSASGQVLLNASIAGGSGATGLFVWEAGVLRKVAAANDPNPVGGTFSQDFTTAIQRINPAGRVVFIANNSVFENTAGGGTTTAIAAGSAVPPPMGGTFNAFTAMPGLSSSGDAILFANVTGGASVSGLFRYRNGSGVEVVARLNETAPGTGGKTFTGLSSASVNASGTVSFQGNMPNNFQGLFQKPAGGANALVALNDAATPAGGTFFITGFATITLTNGAVIGRAHIMNAPNAHHGVFQWLGGATALMTTGDTLPDGGSEVIRPNFLTGAGGFIGVSIQLAGGREVIAYYNPSTQTADGVSFDGDPVWALGGGSLQLQNTNTVLVNAAGDVVVQASVFGGFGAFVRNAILIGGQTTELAAIAFDNIQDNGGRFLSSLNLNNLGVRPIPVNASGTVVFTATASGLRGVWVGTANGVPVKVALPGDLASTGAAITVINAVHGGINEVGKVLFTANTAAGQGLFIATPGATPVEVAQVGDAAPGGGTFSGFGTTPNPAFNNGNQVAFLATVAGGAGGGVFLASPDGGGVYSSIEAIALNGAAAPGGGTYVLSTARNEVVINDAGHVVFQADLSGGGSDSGIFARRGPLASVEAIVRQGQTAPGTSSTFTTFLHGVNGFIGENHQLSSTGQVAFFGRVTPPGQSQIVGWWHIETDNSIQPIVVVPSSGPAFDGGTAASPAAMSNWLPGDHFPMWVPLVGAPHDGGLYMYLPLSGASTGSGSNVHVSPVDDLTGSTASVTFSNVNTPGVTTFSRSASGPALPRGWYLSGYLAKYFTLNTTAAFSGDVTVCFDISDHDPINNAVFRLLHYENNAWRDVTTSSSNTEVCGVVTSLSVFAPALALNEPVTNIVQNGTFGSGSTSWQVFATDGNAQDNSYIQWSVNNGVFEYYRVPPPPGLTNQAVVLQDTGQAFGAGEAVVAHFDIGNSSSTRKRISVLIREANFLDLSVCTFFIPPNTPMRSYAMRTHTTIPWAGASISFYAASAGSDGGAYQLDNVVMGPGHDLTLGRTDCVDPGEPGLTGSASNPNLLVNGDFSNGLNNWTAVGTDDGRLVAQVTNGVAQFIRPTVLPNVPSGVLLQPTGAVVGAGQVVTATFRLGNSSVVRKRITVLLHDFTFGDLAACTFWLPAGQPLSDYMMRTYTTQAWSSATISVYPATTDSAQWFELDDVTLRVTPASQTYGSDCVEPNDDSGLSGSAPEPVPAPVVDPAVVVLAAPPQAEIPAWAGLVLIDRRRMM